jgi:hypothetical protein
MGAMKKSLGLWSMCTGGAARIFPIAAIASFLLAQTAFGADFAGTARLIRERRGHTATALGDGKVLIAGGENAAGALSDVETFDAASRTFSVAARLLTPRADHTASRLPDGRVLFVGGRGAEPLASTELYDPVTGVFSAGPALNCARFGHTATLLADGRLVVVGGDMEGTAEVFDPRTESFVELPGRLSQARSFHAAARLADGKILLAGGVARDGTPLRSAEILDLETSTFASSATPMLTARSRFALRVLPDGKVQAIGGDAEGTMELFNPAGRYFTSLGHLGGASATASAAMRNAGRAAVIGRSAPASLDDQPFVEEERETPRLIRDLLDRTGHSLTEIPESNEAIAAGGVSSSGQYQPVAVLFSSSSATVTTDKTDYSPGETVIITGTGWQPGETVDLNIHRDNDNPPDTLLHAVADVDGNIRNDEFVIQESDRGVTFVLTATGQSSGYTAQTTFTDGNLDTTVTPTTVTVVAGGPGQPFVITSSVSGATGAGWGFKVNTVWTISGGVCTGSVLSAQHNVAAQSGSDPPQVFNTPANAFAAAGQSSGTFTCTINEVISQMGSGAALAVGNSAILTVIVTTAGPCAGQPSGFGCRASAGDCDVAETCDGVSPLCPPDLKSTAVCRPSAGACDVAESCNGVDNDCPADTLQPSGEVCRAPAGVCDLAEQCTGTSAQCPADAKSTAECRPSAGICDVAESCDGTNDDCPADDFQPSSFECRTSAGVCDPAEQCTGTSATCPADAKSTAECRASAGICDVSESCDGVNDDCPADDFQPSSFECRASAGVCDPAENCTGSSAACPADAKSTAECRASAGVCDVAESCDGVNNNCPADAFEPATEECRASAGVCDPAENCTGAGPACPADVKSTAVCRPAADICDVSESCDGVNDDCPADDFRPSDFECRASAGVCDLAENCTGSSAACPVDAKSTAVCRPAADVCDVAESCDGNSNNCPLDEFRPNTFQCRGAAGVCDAEENCTGAAAACPPDLKKGPETTCRPAASDCDVAEVCTGLSDSCPANVFEPAGTPCEDANICDGIETCDGDGTCQQGIPQECKATGGGQIDGLAEITILRGTNVGGRANFGFNAQLAAGASTASGHLTYIDHDMDKKVKSVSVDTLQIIGNTAIFTGMATVNGAGPFEFEVRVQDWGEPGSNAAVTPDDFSISVDGYTAFGFLIAGNIQVHGSFVP